MKKVAATFVLYFSWIIISSSTTAYDTYENARFNYQISYPLFLKPQGESQNGDGQGFIGKNATLSVYGSFFPNIESQKDEKNYKIQDEFNYEKIGIKQKGFTLDFWLLKKDFYVISAFNSTTIVYMKKIFAKPCGVHAYFWLYYPKEAEKQWIPIVTIISKSFQFSTHKCQGDYKIPN
ncbi:Uncharacterised protein [Legionella busanensis]|uniref:Uncharacterized protein n=1 Tax=Legionella busanensis TaxID=190655 RepID=A0A378JU72_9GAMM|nr:hypothetical protein [Legionella busanensis]STX51752.1 Uncharacterised protein [Legionella busanensis]